MTTVTNFDVTNYIINTVKVILIIIISEYLA